MARERCGTAGCPARVSEVVQYRNGDDTERYCTGCWDTTILDLIHTLTDTDHFTIRRQARVRAHADRSYWLVG